MANLTLPVDENASPQEKQRALSKHLKEWRSQVNAESLRQQRENEAQRLSELAELESE